MGASRNAAAICNPQSAICNPSPSRLLLEDWLPAHSPHRECATIGVAECIHCMRGEKTGGAGDGCSRCHDD